ncbi:MAG TPA: ABC transporter substrate-binding protein, partial [Reyranella sp.]|nr:ABC transporter substrate-binding protein [Reyranella sp.]
TPLFALGKPALAADKVLNIGAAVFPDSLRAGTASFASLSLLNQTNDQLITRDNKGDLHPALAAKWELIDPLTMRFTLRQGVKFTDGVEFTAEDVAFTIKYVLDPQTAYAQAARINQVATATVVDKYTVDIKTKVVFPTLLRGLSDIIMQPKHYVEKVGINGFANKPMGTGPFIFQEWVPGDHYTLTANKNYWGGAPKIDKVVIRTIPDGSTRVASLVSGESHIVEEIPIDLIDQVNASGSAKIDQIATTVGLVLTFDPTIKPFDNSKIREAFDYAIDKPLILKQILKGQGDILQGQVLTRDALGFNPDLKARPFDPEKAKAMLKEQGFDFNTPVPITTQNGKYVSDTDICQAIAGMLNKIGVKATVNIVEGGVFQQMNNALKFGPLHMIGWYNLGDADFATVWYTKAGLRTRWYSEEYDKMFVAARSTNDTDERVKIYREMGALAYRENPSLFLFGLPSIYGVGKNVKGFGAAADKVLRLSQVELGK